MKVLYIVTIISALFLFFITFERIIKKNSKNMIKGDAAVFDIRYPTIVVKQLLQVLFQLEHTITERSDRRGKR